jgi:uncharacterized protein
VPTIREAFKAGDLETLRSLVEDPSEFPNGWLGHLWGYPLEYAIYHSPLSFIRGLLDLGADPNYQDDASFPSLLAALSTERDDRYEILELLLAAGADVQQRGVNDYTPLHYAATRNDARAVELLLAPGADPAARTRIDERTTPLEEAERLNLFEVMKVLRQAGSDL